MFKIAIAAAAVAIAAALPAHADITTRCRSMSVGGYYERACATTIDIPAPAPEAATPFHRGPGSTELVRFNPVEAARRLAIPKHDPQSVDLCAAPMHMTARDGCQR